LRENGLFHYLVAMANDLPHQLGAKIREIRKGKNLTQVELAKLCKMDQNDISSIESGKRKLVSVLTLQKIAKSLGVTIKELF
jgi:transcriptional regulator with XRE-family HTH domain